MSGTISGKICHPLNIEPTIQVRDKLFDLYGVVTHHGSSLNSGHYTATASHSKSCDAKWWHFDDSVVKRLDSTTIHNIKDAYMLFYKKRDGFPPTDAVDSSHQQERIMEEPNSSLHYYTPLSSDMLESIRYDNCKYLLELFLAQILQAQARAIELSELEKKKTEDISRELVYEEKSACACRM